MCLQLQSSWRMIPKNYDIIFFIYFLDHTYKLFGFFYSIDILPWSLVPVWMTNMPVFLKTTCLTWSNKSVVFAPEFHQILIELAHFKKPVRYGNREFLMRLKKFILHYIYIYNKKAAIFCYIFNQNSKTVEAKRNLIHPWSFKIRFLSIT